MRCWKVNIIIYLSIFVFGLILGSFFNVCIYRIPRKESIIYPPSHCPKCGTTLKPYDNIPLVSYVLLKGKCRYCKAKISILYPIVELLTGILYVSIYIKTRGIVFDFMYFLIFISLLIIITFIDLENMIIPDILVFPGIFLGIFLAYFRGVDFLLSSLLGAGIGGLVILLIVLLSRGGMGIGDIKFSTMIGAFLGMKYLIMVLILSFIIGGIIGIILLLLKIKKRKDPIPFGPFLSLAAIIVIFWGESIGRMWGWF